MNWLWVIIGAIAGALLLQQSGGLLLGAILGAMASSLSRNRRTEQVFEKRLRELERKLAVLTPAASSRTESRVNANNSEPAVFAQSAEPDLPSLRADEPTALPLTTPQPAAHTLTKPAPASTDPAWAHTPNPWQQRLLSGNLLAKAGVVLLFFGAASGLKMAADYGMFPPSVRLLMAALAGVALIAFGHNRARQSAQQAFGFAVQGGGFALLYLSLYFAFSRYAYIDATLAFGGFALLGVGCALLAMRQDSPALAWLGLSGAFFAPALASSGGNHYQILFGHFLLLDIFIVAISSRKGWRSLNLLGFFLTTLFGLAWALERYSIAFRPDIEAFLLAFFVLYTLAPALLAHYRQPASKTWLDGTLLFGLPAVAAMVQGALGYERDYLALTALLAGLYYLGLAALTRRSDNPVLPRAFIALAITCLTVAIPLYFGASVTAVFWALEGAAVLAFGLHQKRRLAVFAGAAIQALAAVRLFDAHTFLNTSTLFLNDFFPGALALALAGGVSAWRLYRHGNKAFSQPLVLGWTIVWWLLAGWNEASTQMTADHHYGAVLFWMSAGALALEGIAARLDWAAGRYAATALWPVTLLALLAATGSSGHPLASWMALSLPLAFAVAYGILHRQQADGLHVWLHTRHLALFWVLMLAAVLEAGWQAEQLAPATPLWAPVAILAVLCLGLLGLRQLQQHKVWPVAGLDTLYDLAAPAPLAAGLVLGVALLNLNFSGRWDLPYLPLLNPLDLISLLALASLWHRWNTASWQQHTGHIGLALLSGIGLLWLTALWARIAHHFLDVALTGQALQHSALFQAGVSLLWTAVAIAAMLLGSRRQLRQTWFVGVGLLGIVGIKLLFLDLGQASLATRTATLLGMGGLILIAGYFAPAPPRNESA
ncbi:MAG: DUF2339 domain-containing protein [Thiobacillus sp.]|nr:DUF2339 domain-containing protein [Thiobacillus sp.]